MPVLYVTSLIAGVISGLGSARFLGSSGFQRAVPALLVGVVVALVVLAVGTFVVARRAERETIERMARQLLWVVFVMGGVPGLVWFALWFSSGDLQALYGLAAVAVSGLPVLAAVRRPAALPLTTGFCLLCGVAALVFGQRLLFLLLPLFAAVTGGWLLVLALLGSARRRRSETVVPSN